MISLAFPAEDDLIEKTEKKKLVGKVSQSSKTAFACVPVTMPVTQCRYIRTSEFYLTCMKVTNLGFCHFGIHKEERYNHQQSFTTASR